MGRKPFCLHHSWSPTAERDQVHIVKIKNKTAAERDARQSPPSGWGTEGEAGPARLPRRPVTSKELSWRVIRFHFKAQNYLPHISGGPSCQGALENYGRGSKVPREVIFGNLLIAMEDDRNSPFLTCLEIQVSAKVTRRWCEQSRSFKFCMTHGGVSDARVCQEEVL